MWVQIAYMCGYRWGACVGTDGEHVWVQIGCRLRAAGVIGAECRCGYRLGAGVGTDLAWWGQIEV